MRPGPQIPAEIRELARRMAWTADYANIPVGTTPADLIAALHAQGYYLKHDSFELLQAVGYSYNFRQMAAGITEGNEALTLGQLQQMHGMPIGRAEIHFRFGVAVEDQGGVRYENVVQVSVDPMEDRTVRSIIDEAIQQARYNVGRGQNYAIIREENILWVSPVA